MERTRPSFQTRNWSREGSTRIFRQTMFFALHYACCPWICLFRTAMVASYIPKVFFPAFYRFSSLSVLAGSHCFPTRCLLMYNAIGRFVGAALVFCFRECICRSVLQGVIAEPKFYCSNSICCCVSRNQGSTTSQQCVVSVRAAR